jgi:ribosomal protein L37E/DNA-directed RNA polymerase subunit RPC12/RpoP
MPSVVEIPCPECEKTLKVPDTVFGKKIKCKYCTHAFVVKDPNEAKKPGVKPSKPGGAAVKPKKEEPKPEPKKEEEKPADAPYKFQDDDDEGAKPNPLGVINEEDVARCPFCAKELDPPDAKVCIHCGFNNMTRTRAESKKVWAPDTNDWINHLGPGVLALVIFIGLIVLDILCWVNMRGWMTDTFLQKDEKDAQGEIAFYVKPGAFITFVIAATILPIIGTARFAIRRLFIEYQPTEKVKTS